MPSSTVSIWSDMKNVNYMFEINFYNFEFNYFREIWSSKLSARAK